MKKFLVIAIVTMFLSSCGVGTYSYSSGLENKCGLSFVAEKSKPLTVTVDGQSYSIDAVKLKKYRTDRKIKQTTRNTILLESGKHDVKVVMDGSEVFSKTIFVSGNETKIIEL